MVVTDAFWGVSTEYVHGCSGGMCIGWDRMGPGFGIANDGMG